MKPALAYELAPGQLGPASAFMEGLVGSSDYAAALGANFSSLIMDKYGITADEAHRFGLPCGADEQVEVCAKDARVVEGVDIAADGARSSRRL